MRPLGKWFNGRRGRPPGPTALIVLIETQQEAAKLYSVAAATNRLAAMNSVRNRDLYLTVAAEFQREAAIESALARRLYEVVIAERQR